MSQTELALLGRLDGPEFLPDEAIARIHSYRQAVLTAWAHRRTKGLTQRGLLERMGRGHPAHVSDWLHSAPRDTAGNTRRELPAECIPAFELAVGNHCITQWLARQARVTLMEEVMARRAA